MTGGNYPVLCAIGAVALLLALAVDPFAARSAK
ncbi:hypothetical protein QFZ91_004658 [Paraburkholderia sp. JPY419]